MFFGTRNCPVCWFCSNVLLLFSSSKRYLNLKRVKIFVKWWKQWKERKCHIEYNFYSWAQSEPKWNQLYICRLPNCVTVCDVVSAHALKSTKIYLFNDGNTQLKKTPERLGCVKKKIRPLPRCYLCAIWVFFGRLYTDFLAGNEKLCVWSRFVDFSWVVLCVVNQACSSLWIIQ